MNYPSNLSDTEWEIIKPCIQSSRRGRKAQICRRSIINAIFYQSRTGCQWQYLPKDFPNYKTVNYYYNQWIKSGVWEKLHDKLVIRCRAALGKKTRQANGRYY